MLGDPTTEARSPGRTFSRGRLSELIAELEALSLAIAETDSRWSR